MYKNTKIYLFQYIFNIKNQKVSELYDRMEELNGGRLQKQNIYWHDF